MDETGLRLGIGELIAAYADLHRRRSARGMARFLR